MGIEARTRTGRPRHSGAHHHQPDGGHTQYHKIDEIARQRIFDGNRGASSQPNWADDSQLRNIRDMRSFPANHRGSREKIGWPRNGPTVFALLGKELGQVILQLAENKDGKPTPGGKVYTRH